MRDNALFILLRGQILPGLSERGFVNVRVEQNYQPIQHGRPNASTVFVTKILDKRHGSRRIDERFDKELEEVVREESQVVESTFQFAALISERDPANDAEETASDLLKATAAILQSPDFIDAIGKTGVQILRITDIRSTPIDNDRNRFEFEPSFDAVLTHTDVFRKTIPALDRISSGIYRI
jgi:hypothetical protein